MPEIPAAVRTAIDYLVSIGLTAAVVGGVVSWIFNFWLSERIKGRIKGEYDEKLEALKAQLKGQYDEKIETLKAQLKAQGDVELEKLKSDLNIAAAQRNFQFSHLHEKRADVIAEIYAALREALIAINDYTNAFEPVGGAPRDERRKAAVEAANAFARLYLSKQIYLPEAATVKLDEMNQELRIAFRQFAYGVDMMRDKGLDSTKIWVAVGEKVQNLSNTAMRELEREFRLLLGDDSAVTTSASG